MRQLVYIIFITNNHDSFHLWWKENLAKHQKVSKYYDQDCSRTLPEKTKSSILTMKKLVLFYQILTYYIETTGEYVTIISYIYFVHFVMVILWYIYSNYYSCSFMISSVLIAFKFLFHCNLIMVIFKYYLYRVLHLV